MAATPVSRRGAVGPAEPVAPPTTLREVRVPHAGLLAAAMAVIAFLALLYESQNLRFFYDEWDFVLGAPGWTLRSYFLPHSEHWSTIPMLIYRVLLGTFGASHYQPFIATLLLLHAGTALLLFRIVRRRSGDVLALISAAALLLLGRGYENILWAFQIGFVGSLFFGLIAVDLLDTPPVSRVRAGFASAALVASLMCSGIGLIMCGLVTVDLLLDGRRRRLLPLVIVAPAMAYAAWDLAFGASASSVYGPISFAGLLALRTYVPFGIGSAAAGLAGLSTNWVPLALAGLVAALALRWPRLGRLDSRIVAATAALVAQFTLTGIVRYRLGDIQAASPRYVYIGSIFLLLLLSQSFAGVAWSRRLGASLLVVVVASIGYNAYLLREAAHAQASLFVRQDAELETATVFRGAPGLNNDARIDSALMPTVGVGRYFAATDQEGSEVPSISFDQLPQLPGIWVDNALVNLFGEATVVQPLGPPGTAPSQPIGSGCTTLTAGDTGASVQLMADQRLLIPAPQGAYDLYLWAYGPPAATPVETVAIGPAGVSIQVPDTGHPVPWQVRVAVPPGTIAYQCRTASGGG